MIDINPEEYYAASTIMKNRWFPWIKHVNTLRRMLLTPEGHAMYKPVIHQAGKRTIKKIKGDVILQVIELSNKGLLKI